MIRGCLEPSWFMYINILLSVCCLLFFLWCKLKYTLLTLCQNPRTPGTLVHNQPDDNRLTIECVTYGIDYGRSFRRKWNRTAGLILQVYLRKSVLIVVFFCITCYSFVMSWHFVLLWPFTLELIACFQYFFYKLNCVNSETSTL